MSDGAEFSRTNTATFGLSKDLAVPVQVKVGFLQSTNEARAHLASLSDKFQHPSVFKTLSRIHKNSDLYVSVAVYDGYNNNQVSIALQTPYKSLIANKRTWNTHLKLSHLYSQVGLDAYLKLTVYEIVDTKPVVFGIGYLSLFNKKTSSLRKGAQKIPIYQNTEEEHVEYHDIPGLTKLEELLIDYENGDYPHVNWLDKLSLARIKKEAELNTDHDFYLYVELPSFDLPVVYSDIIYQTPELIHNSEENPVDPVNSSIVMNSIDIPMTKLTSKDSYKSTSSARSEDLYVNGSTQHTPSDLKVYDPDFNFAFINNPQNTAAMLDPIELKYHKLERNINNSSILDKELKPSPQLRDELLKILTKPSNIELNDVEKNLIWKFRYFFSKNNSVGTGLGSAGGEAGKGNITTTKSFFPKFLKSINWNNDYELRHVFEEIVPNYWSVDKLQIGDALELLSSYFNPHTLCPMPIESQSIQEAQVPVTPSSKRNDKKAEESKGYRVFKYVTYLRNLAVDRLKLASNDELLLYLLQLVQALKYESVIYNQKFPTADASENFQIVNELNYESEVLKSPLAKFLIEKAVQSESLGNFFYWYVKVENEDQLSQNLPQTTKSIYTAVLNRYIESLKKYSHSKKLPYYKHLKRQIWFIKKLTNLVELIRTSFRRNEPTAKKKEFLKEYLANASNELLKFPESFPLPLDPSVTICGCYPEESSVFKSSLSPLKITFKTVIHKPSSSSQLFGKRHTKYGKYPLMFKIGDDLRQDQLVIQIINLMDQLLKNENLDLKLTPYKILATSPIAGLIQFVPNETLDSILARNYPEVGDAGGQSSGILNYMKLHEAEAESRPDDGSASESQTRSVIQRFGDSEGNSSIQNSQSHQPIITSDLGVSNVLMDNYVKSCAGYCVITYLLGVGDRHLDNLLLSPNGKFWHADFGYILGRDPKPFPPLMKLPIEVIDGMGGLAHENFDIFKSYCFITYTTLRKNSNLILNLFQLMLDANIPDIKIDPKRAIEKVQEKFCLEMTEEEAILHFQNLINDSVNAFLPVVIDRLHSLAQYWRA